MKLEARCVLTIVLSALVACGVSEEAKQAFAVEIDAVEAFSSELETARVAALTAFVDEPTEVPSECPDGLLRGEEWTANGNRDAQNLTTILITELDEELSPRADLVGRAVFSGRSGLDPDNVMTAIDSNSELERRQAEVAQWADTDFWPVDVTFVMTHRRVPRTTAPGVFEPGYISGWVVAWSYADSRIVCAFEMRQDTPEGVTLENHPDTSQEDELLMYLSSRISTRIRQAMGDL